MPGPTFMSGERVSLHTVEEEDLDLYARSHADPDIRVPLTLDEIENRRTLEERFEEDISGDEGVHLMACVDRETAEAVAGEETVAAQLASDDEDDKADVNADDSEDDAAGGAADADGDPEDDRVAVGSVMFFRVDESAGAAKLAYWVLPEYQGEGFGREAVSLLLEYGFDELRLNRVGAHCLATNEASSGLLESLGFEREGRRRERHFVDGEYVDALGYGLLAAEWRDA